MSFDFVFFLLAWAIPKYRTNESRVNRRQAESNSQACLNIAEARRRKTKSSLLSYAECSRYSTKVNLDRGRQSQSHLAFSRPSRPHPHSEFPPCFRYSKLPIALLPTCHISTIYNNVYRPLKLFIFHRQLNMCEICHDVQLFFCSVFLFFYEYHTRKYIIVTILIEF